LELCVWSEAKRAFNPTVSFEDQPSEYIPMLESDPTLQAFQFREIETGFEFLVKSNFYLRVMRV
jgi:hypothetical protein